MDVMEDDDVNIVFLMSFSQERNSITLPMDTQFYPP